MRVTRRLNFREAIARVRARLQSCRKSHQKPPGFNPCGTRAHTHTNFSDSARPPELSTAAIARVELLTAAITRVRARLGAPSGSRAVRAPKRKGLEPRRDVFGRALPTP